MKKISLLSVLILFIFSADFVSAESRDHSEWQKEKALFASLNLTPEQTEKVLNIRTLYLKDNVLIRNQIFNKRMELKLLWMQLKPDPEKIRLNQKEIHDLRWQLKEKRTAYRLSFRNILNQEQLSKYVTLEQGLMRDKSKRKRK